MVNIRPLPPALAAKAQNELNEDPNRIEDEIEILRNWILKQSHLKARTDDQFLITFLRGCKHSIEKAKEKIDYYYTIRSAMPELFTNRNPDDPKIREILKMGVGLILPIPNGKDDCTISIIRSGIYDPAKYNIREILRVGIMIGDIQMLEDDNVVVSGRMEILDLNNVTAAHLFQFEPTFIKKMTKLCQDGTPLRQKGFHFINTPPGFEIAFNMFTKFMNEKHRNRIRVHRTIDSLYEYVPKRLLPVEYGGENGSIEDIINHWEKKILTYRDYFLEEENYGSDETRRIGAPQKNSTLFGVDGTFQKLQVD